MCWIKLHKLRSVTEIFNHQSCHLHSKNIQIYDEIEMNNWFNCGFGRWHRLDRCTREKRKAPVKSGFIYSSFCVLSWSAGWPHGDICDSIDVNLILQWNQKPCVILMWGLSKRPRIHWGDDTTHTQARTHTSSHMHTLWKRESKHRCLHGVKGKVW